MPSDDRFSEENQRPFTKYPLIKRKPEYKPRAKVYGTPPTWEALFQCIEQNKTEDATFTWMRRLFKKYSDEQLWQFYEAWCLGVVHPDLK